MSFVIERQELLLCPQPVIHVPSDLATLFLPNFVCHYGDFIMTQCWFLFRYILHFVVLSPSRFSFKRPSPSPLAPPPFDSPCPEGEARAARLHPLMKSRIRLHYCA